MRQLKITGDHRLDGHSSMIGTGSAVFPENRLLNSVPGNLRGLDNPVDFIHGRGYLNFFEIDDEDPI